MTQDANPRRSRRFRSKLLLALATLVLLPVLAAGWLLLTESGLRAAVDIARRVTGVEFIVQGLSGRIVGPLRFDTLTLENEDLRVIVEDVAFDWYPRALAQGQIDIDRLDIASIDVAVRPSEKESTEPPSPPGMGLPLLIVADRITLGRLGLQPWQVEAAHDAPVFELRDFGVTLARDGRSQQILDLQVTTSFGEIVLDASVDPSIAPYPLSSRGRFRTIHEGYEVDVDYTLSGDLNRLELALEAHGADLEGAADVVIAPFAPMPLVGLRAVIGVVDPAVFVAGAPRAALHIEADLDTAEGEELLAGRLRILNDDPARIDEGGLPFEELTARVGWAAQRIEVSELEMRAVGEARLTGQGHVQLGEHGVQGFAASGSLSRLNPIELMAEAPKGDVSLKFEASGAPDGVIALDWSLGPGRLADVDVNGSGHVVIDGERLADAVIDVSVGRNAFSLRGAWGGAGDELLIALDASRLESLALGFAGSAKLDASLSGTLADPTGRFSLDASRLMLPDGVYMKSLDASGRLDAGVNGPVALRLTVDGLGPNAKESWFDRASVVIEGTRAAHQIDLALAMPDDSLSARLEGGLAGVDGTAIDLERLQWIGQLLALETLGRLPLKLEAPAELSIAPSRVVLAEARLGAGEKGSIVLEETQWTPERIAARGRLTGLTIVETASTRSRARRGPGPLVLGAEWDLALTDTANGNLRVFRESGDISVPGELSARIGLEHLELIAVASENRLAASLDARGTELGTVTGSLTALAERDADAGWRIVPDAELLGSVRMDMPSIGWLARLMQDETVLDGGVRAEFSVSGTPAQPVAVGRIVGSGLSLALVEHGVQLSGGEFVAEFDRDYLRLTRLEFISPNRVRPGDARVPVDALTRTPGRLSASGEIALASGKGAFAFEADRLPLLQRTDRWLILSGKGTAESTWTTLHLDADFRADAGYVEFAQSPPPSLSDDVFIVGSEAEGSAGGLKLSANVRVSLGEALYLSALGLETRLSGELAMRLRDGESLSASGTISTVGGSYRGYGQSLSIERGLINFQGPLDNPGLNVVALRKGLAVEAGVAVTGSARRPLIRLVSDPDVPDPDKLGWIVLGRAPGAGADMGLLLPAAQALLGGPGGGMTEQLQRSLGLDEFGIGAGELGGSSRTRTSRVVGGGSTVSGEGNLSGQVLTLGKRLSTDLFLSFEQSLGGAESLVKLTYQLGRRVSVVARGGTDTAADVYYTISFR